MSVVEKIQVILSTFSGRGGVAACPLDKDEAPVTVNAKEVFPIASAIKVPILIEVMAQVEAGRLTLDERIMVRAENKVDGTGVLKVLGSNIELSLLDLCRLMIVVSDNTATNLLLDRLGGPESVSRRMAEWGLPAIQLRSRIDFGRLWAQGPKSFSVATPVAFTELLVRLGRPQILTPASCELILDIMSQQQHNDMIPRYLPWNYFAQVMGLKVQVWYAGKSGMLPGARTDTALIALPHVRYAVAIMTDGSRDHSGSPDNEGTLVVARISKVIFDHYAEGGVD